MEHNETHFALSAWFQIQRVSFLHEALQQEVLSSEIKKKKGEKKKKVVGSQEPIGLCKASYNSL